MQPLGFELPVSVLKSFKKVQDALGLWHDYVVLGTEALEAALEEDLARHNPQLHGEILALAQLCWRRSEVHLNRFANVWSEQGPAIVSEVLDVFRPLPNPIATLAAAPENGKATRSDRAIGRVLEPAA